MHRKWRKTNETAMLFLVHIIIKWKVSPVKRWTFFLYSFPLIIGDWMYIIHQSNVNCTTAVATINIRRYTTVWLMSQNEMWLLLFVFDGFLPFPPTVLQINFDSLKISKSSKRLLTEGNSWTMTLGYCIDIGYWFEQVWRNRIGVFILLTNYSQWSFELNDCLRRTSNRKKYKSSTLLTSKRGKEQQDKFPFLVNYSKRRRIGSKH